MTKKQQTAYGMIGLVIGIISGIAGTAFSMGAERQHVRDALIKHTSDIDSIKLANSNYADNTEKEMNRYAKIIAAHMTQLQENIANLNTTVGNLRTDVQVLKALMERMEKDRQSNSG